VDKNGQHIYREFFVPSPTTALVEANILTKLSALSQFQSSPAVYSYRWPRPTSGRLFQHYFAGFSRRNEDITAALKSSKENVAVVTDVKSYYPSIRRGPLLLNLKNRLKLSGAGARFSGHVESTVAAMLNQTAEVGIPIGPPLSHFLGQLALAQVDTVLEKTYPGRYFRYVDDIVIVVPRNRAEAAQKDVSVALSNEGLLINELKTEVASREVWFEERYIESGHNRKLKFEEFLDRLAIYFILNPTTFKDVAAIFRERGFSLPLTRILARSQDSRYRRFLRALIRGTAGAWYGGWPEDRWLEVSHRWRYLADNLDTLLRDAETIKGNFIEHSERLGSMEIPGSGLRRRRYLQECRFVFNRLMYLTPIEDYSKLLNAVPKCNELVEIRASLQSISEGSLDPLLTLPGAAPRTVGELSREMGLDMKAPSTEAMQQARKTSPIAYRDSIAILTLFGAYRPSKTDIEEELGLSDRPLIQFCAGLAAPRRETADFSYIDEIRCLQLGRNRSDITTQLVDRMGDLEDFILEGLALGEDYYGI